MRCSIIKVLIWKILIEKKRRPITTVWEIALPIFLLYVLFILWTKDIADSESEGSDSNLVYFYDPESYFSKRESPNRLFYYPSTNLTYELMNLVGKKLRETSMSSLHREIGIYPLTNMSMINQLIPELHKEDCIIHFKDISGDKMPDRLKYALHMRKDTGSHLQRVSYYPFMRLQLAIDTSYIEMLTGKPLDMALTLQEVPLSTSSSEKPTDLIMGLQLATILAMIIPFTFNISKLVSERVVGIEALMQVAGVSLKELYCGHALNILPGGLLFSISATVISKFAWSSLSKANGFLIFIFFVLYYTSIICASIAVSYVLGSGQYSSTMASILYILLTIPAHMLVHKATVPKAAWFLAGLLFQYRLYTFWYQTFHLENKDEGLTFNSIFKSSHKFCSAFLSLTNLVVQIVIFIFLAWYLSRVRPGKHGFPYPWNFLCTKQYWKKPINERIVETEEKPIPQIYQQYFEPQSGHREVGVKVVDVTKKYGSAKALDRVSLNIYKEEITVLLGHNGAGKTTLMSIITSMLAPTHGKIFLNGVDITEQRIRINIGYCPQHNVNFPNLTVLEHAKLFALLRGAKVKEAHVSSLNLLNKMNLEDKANTRVRTLSGGMQRRLQLICALSGSPTILILDEPTAGLDVETRRELWNILLAFRGHHTMLLATHFMEEADALGDRIAALHAGELRCNATPMFLKKAIGTGYVLNIKAIGKPNTEGITGTITSVIPEARLKEQLLNSLTYNLPAVKSNSFPALFEALEGQKTNLKIDGIGLGGTSLEDVFVKLCSDTNVDLDLEEEAATVVPLYQKRTGSQLYLQQLKALLFRQMRFTWNRKITFLIFTILPIAMVYLLTTWDVTEEMAESKLIKDNIMLKDSDNSSDFVVLLNTPRNASIYNSIFDEHLKARLKNGYYSSQSNNNQRTQDISSHKKRNNLIGIDINNASIKVLYRSVDRHVAPKALNALNNALASRLLSRPDDDNIITTINQPFSSPLSGKVKKPRPIVFALLFILLVSEALQLNMINKMTLPIQERVTGTRHNYIMNGSSILLFWISTVIYHLIISYVFVFLPALIIIATLDVHDTFVHKTYIAVMLYVLFIGCLAMLTFLFIFSYCLPIRAAPLLSCLFVFGFGLPTPLFHVMEELKEGQSFLLHVFRIICFFIPHHAFSMALSMLACTASLNALIIVHKSSERFLCYLCFPTTKEKKLAAGAWVLILTLQFFAYFTLLILMELKVCKKLFSCKPSNLQPCPDIDKNVIAEAAYVAHTFELPKDEITDAMLVHQVHKHYRNIIRKSFHAVKGVSFSVKKGECFGLLGVNGAGKTSTFKMLTADELPTKGKVMANRLTIKDGKEKYMRALGYCPQFFGIDDFLTGKQVLEITLTLRGFYPRDIVTETNNWIDIVGLQKYAKRLTSSYSGGCKRRIATAVAMCGEAPVALLDEPTAGVDLTARRKVWAALRRGLLQGRSIVITSHSMDEMEVLCSRIAIMSGGCIVALGSALDLRLAHSSGYVVVFKLHREEITTDAAASVKSRRDVLKEEMSRKFKCALKEDHEIRLHYDLNKDIKYSDLFRSLEQLKQAYPDLIEDYWVSETTLEEVFLSLAKTHHTDTNTPVTAS